MACNKGIKVSIRIPENVPEVVRRQKINRIYDILAIALSTDSCYTTSRVTHYRPDIFGG